MIKTYYKFALDKETLISTEQSSYEGFTCVIGIYVDAIGEPDLGDSTVKCQGGMWIPKGLSEITEAGVETPAKDLVGYLIEKLWSQPLQGQYFEKLYIL